MGIIDYPESNFHSLHAYHQTVPMGWQYVFFNWIRYDMECMSDLVKVVSGIPWGEAELSVGLSRHGSHPVNRSYDQSETSLVLQGCDPLQSMTSGMRPLTIYALFVSVVSRYFTNDDAHLMWNIAFGSVGTSSRSLYTSQHIPICSIVWNTFPQLTGYAHSYIGKKTLSYLSHTTFAYSTLGECVYTNVLWEINNFVHVTIRFRFEWVSSKWIDIWELRFMKINTKCMNHKNILVSIFCTKTYNSSDSRSFRADSGLMGFQTGDENGPMISWLEVGDETLNRKKSETIKWKLRRYIGVIWCTHHPLMKIHASWEDSEVIGMRPGSDTNVTTLGVSGQRDDWLEGRNVST